MEQEQFLRRYGLYAVLHPHQDEYTDIYYEVAYFLQLVDQFVNRKHLKSYQEQIEYGTQHIWGNLFHITLIGFLPMNENNLEELKTILRSLKQDDSKHHAESENIKLVWRKSSDKEEPMWDFRIGFENERFSSIVHQIHDRMEFYREENNKRRLRLRNDYHGSLLSDVKLTRREEIVEYLAQHQAIIPNIYKIMMTEGDHSTQQSIQELINEQFKKLTWALQIVSYEDPKQPLNKWQEHDMILLD